jgi:hypothetical protein
MQARYYDPVIGRFYSNDPVDAVSHLSNAEGIKGFNRYSYAVNNPYKYSDPDGRSIQSIMYMAPTPEGMTTGQYQQAINQGTGIGLAVATVLVPGPEDLVIGAAIAKTFRGADSAVSGVKLEKQLASESQVTELAAGGGKVLSQPAKQANRIAEQHGVDAANVQKVSSSAHTAKDGSQVQTHAFRDAPTNKVIEPKSIIDETN